MIKEQRDLAEASKIKWRKNPFNLFDLMLTCITIINHVNKA